jgi:hypothetical protein
MEPKVRIRATASEMEWIGDGDDAELVETDSGWVQPHNPYGSLIWQDVPDTEETDWPYRVEVLPLREAARYLHHADAPVWDYHDDSEYSTMDYRTGRERCCWLHVDVVADLLALYGDPSESRVLEVLFRMLERLEGKVTA